MAWWYWCRFHGWLERTGRKYPDPVLCREMNDKHHLAVDPNYNNIYRRIAPHNCSVVEAFRGPNDNDYPEKIAGE
jgi:hypothetical protein